MASGWIWQGYEAKELVITTTLLVKDEGLVVNVLGANPLQ